MLTFYIPLLIICLILSAFFSASETSLMSLNKYRLRYLVKKEKKNAKTLQNILAKPEKLLGAILLGNNFVNIAASSIAAAVAINLFREEGIVYSTVFMTAVLLIFCEIIPKTYAASHPVRISFRVIRPIYFLMNFFGPFIKIVMFFSNLFLKVLGLKKADLKPSFSEDELRALISIGAEEGVVDESVNEMVHNVFSIKTTFVREVMVPRGEAFGLDSNSSFNETVNLISKTSFSRIPVYDNDFDNIVGVVHTKDVIKYYDRPENFDLRNIMKKPFFVPDSAKIGKLIQTFQKERAHLAIVVDEYGGVEGIVTLEDILEEIVGDIFDEHDVVDIEMQKTGENTYLIDGGMQIKELNSQLGLDLPYDIDNTIAGFMLTLAGHIPKEREVIKYENMTLKVEKRIRRKIDKIRIELNRAESDPTKTESE
ncbi:HlyC/CorC family transporter [Thermodesulfobacteriota bacterium]